MSDPPIAIRFREGVIEFIAEEAERSRDGLETGGVLVGFEHADATEITWAGGLSPNTERQPWSLQRDTAHAQEVVEERWAIDGSDWVGEWHTHTGGLPLPSALDLRTYRTFADHAELAFRHFTSLIVLGHDDWDSLTFAGWVIDSDGLWLAELQFSPRSQSAVSISSKAWLDPLP